MNLNQIVKMLTRLVARRAVNWGLRKGMARTGKASSKAGPKLAATPAKPASPARAASKRARQAARLTRRGGR